MIFKSQKKSLLRVYSHPRSGTHFLEAFLAENFYKNKDLSIPEIKWGHWSNRKIKKDGNPYGKLFGHHFFPTSKNFKSPGIYIIRDGRAVAYSIWKTENFSHKNIDGKLSFNEFLDTPLDWSGSPSRKSDSTMTILEHWEKHCSEWIQYSKNEKKLLIVFYEDLVDQPYQVYRSIKSFNFKFRRRLNKEEINPISKPTGLLPNSATKNSWKGKMSDKNQKLFDLVIKNNNVLRNRYS
jgi:hypothetical protein